MKIKSHEIRLFLLIHLLVSMVFSLIALSVISPQQAWSFVVGVVFLGISLLSISASVYLFFLKKNIALLVGVIVFKWPLIMVLVHEMAKKHDYDPLWLVLGLGTLLPTAIVWSFKQRD